MQYWFKKSVSDILYSLDHCNVSSFGDVSMIKRDMIKIYVALEMLHKINMEAPYEFSKVVTEFIKKTNDLVNRFRIERKAIFAPALYVARIYDFDNIVREIWDINIRHFN